MADESDLSQISIAPVGNTPPPPEPTPQPTPTLEPTPAPVPEPVPAPVPEPTPTPSAFSLRDAAIQRGYDPKDFSDDAALATALFETAEKTTQLEPLANIGRQFAPHADKIGEFQEYLAAKEAEAAKAAEEAAKSAEPPPLDWRKADFDPELLQYCGTDPKTGRYVALHDDWVSHARKLNEATEIRRLNSQRLVDEFPDLQEQYIAPRLAAAQKATLEQVKEFVAQEFQTWKQEAKSEKYIQENLKDFCQHDAAGDLLRDNEGFRVPTPKGRAMVNYDAQLRAAGTTDEGLIQRMTKLAVADDEAAGKFGTPVPLVPSGNGQTPAPTPPPKKFLRRLGPDRSPQRGGTIPDDTAPTHASQNPSASFEEIADRIASEQGIRS